MLYTQKQVPLALPGSGVKRDFPDMKVSKTPSSGREFPRRNRDLSTTPKKSGTKKIDFIFGTTTMALKSLLTPDRNGATSECCNPHPVQSIIGYVVKSSFEAIFNVDIYVLNSSFKFGFGIFTVNMNTIGV